MRRRLFPRGFRPACGPMMSQASHTAVVELSRLLREMNPVLLPETYVFCSVSAERFHSLQAPYLGFFREEEGITLILEKEQAEAAGLAYDYVSRQIILKVHSSLSAVGFLAAVTAELAAEGISANAVSAFYHDRLFVPVEQAEHALSLLQKMTESREPDAFRK